MRSAIRVQLYLSLLLLLSCEQEYDYKASGEFIPQVVLNSLISPDSPISLSVFWSRSFDDTTRYRMVGTFTVTLYEGDNILLESASYTDGEANTPITPREGQKYRIIIDVPDYGQVSAETTIPHKATVSQFRFRKTKGDYRHFTVDGMGESPDNPLAYWIFFRSIYEGREPEGIGEIFSVNPYVDQINSAMDTWEVDQKESNIGFENFVRIPRRNLKYVLPLNLSFYCSDSKYPPIDWENIPADEHDNIIREEVHLTHTILDLITPSSDFDQYYRTLYKQKEYSYDKSAPFLNETVHVYTNIVNGLGIFAGFAINSTSYEFDRP